MTFYFGAHINVSIGLMEAAMEIKRYGGNLMQIFISDIKDNKKQINEFKNFIKKNNIKVVIHSSYLHNIARDWDKYSFWIKNIELEIKIANEFDAIGVVVHFGKQMNLTKEEAYNNMFTSLIHIHKQTEKYNNVKIILETSTGQGTEMCYKLQDLAYFYRKFKNFPDIKNRIRLCIDTCHIFSAGYCLKSIDSIKLFINTFEELIGIKYVDLIHLNDCKVQCGEKKDRHESIGKGYIGFIGLKYFFNYFRKLNIPIVLETPRCGYTKEIKLLKYNL